MKSGELKVEYIPSEDNPADILTKPLGTTLHHCQVGLLQLKVESPDEARGAADSASLMQKITISVVAHFAKDPDNL